ncbi:MAG: SDR family oxidoreductase [Alphaproteobacteria bacterium]|nr:SDR family oxidoreductase [Alphaproteobacteria bacterium]
MTDATNKVAVIAGASGIVGRAAAERLIDLGWRVIGVSRRPPEPALAGIEHIAADLADAEAVRAALSPVASSVTHLFYAGRAPDPDPAAEARRNLAMLVHVVEGLEAGGAPLQHVQLIHGCKWYGSQLGPYRTPAAEDDPRAPMANFYYDQQDWTAARAARSSWTWTALRPHILAGFSLGYPHNSMGVMAAYATLSKARGLPLRFPGTIGAWESLTQVTDLRLLVDAMVWTATTPEAAGEAFNVIDADYFRWCDVWGELAAFFGMEPGPVETVALVDTMKGADAEWARLAGQHGLSEPDLGRIANWGYGDFMWRVWWDDMASTAKIRRLGFDPVYTSRDSLLDALTAYRRHRVIP